MASQRIYHIICSYLFIISGPGSLTHFPLHVGTKKTHVDNENLRGFQALRNLEKETHGAMDIQVGSSESTETKKKWIWTKFLGVRPQSVILQLKPAKSAFF